MTSQISTDAAGNLQVDMDGGWPIYKTFEQLGVLVLDGSSSMTSIESASGLQKAKAVENAAEELGERMATSDMGEQFYLAAVTFDDSVASPVPPTPVLDLDPADLDLDLLRSHGGSTAIGDALAQAGQMVEQFLDGEQDGIPRYAVILLMSDGQSNTGRDPLAVAQQLKDQFADRKPHGPELVIATAAYGDGADARTLGQIASNPDFHRRVENGAELRNYFFHSITQAMSPEAVTE